MQYSTSDVGQIFLKEHKKAMVFNWDIYIYEKR